MKRKLLILLLVPLLGGCALSESRIEQVNQRVHLHQETGQTCFPRDPDRCAAPSPLLDQGRRNVESGDHLATLIEFGEDALKLRLHLVRSARQKVEVQNFILRRDDTGELFLNELLDAARRGVQVRLLLDQMFSFSDAEYLVLLTMTHSNLEIRFYNPSFNKAKMAKHDWLTGLACCFRNVNQRMHNKLLTVDGLAGVVGGRNIADRYFDFDTNYEFKDRDVLVLGPAVRQMQQSFEWFWDSPKTVPVQYLRDVAAELLRAEPAPLNSYEVPPRLVAVSKQAGDTKVMSRLFLEPAFEVERLEYFSDRPRKHEDPDDTHALDITRVLYDVLISARESVLIQSPYMVLSKKARKVFKELRKKNPQIELVFSTNSLASTDADTVYANTDKHKKHYVKTLGFHMYEFKPFPVDAPQFFPRWSELIEEKEQGISSKSVVSGDNSTIEMPAPRSGLHAKSFVVDGRIAMVGSHNFDPRSEGFNTENGLIIWDQAFSQDLEALIRRDTEAQNSWVVAVKPDRNQVNGAIESVSRTLPVFDLWPYRSTSSYELAEGGRPCVPGSPDFYQNYYSVGRFPDVVRTRRQVSVMFLSSFFGFLAPVL